MRDAHHTSLATTDRFAWVNIPTVEVRLSDVGGRPERIRHQKYMASQVIGVISGFGIRSYALAGQALCLHREGQREGRA